jgi:branched-chain amino acid transport system substrate-binding protein
VNAAIKGLKGLKTDILCRPWYYGQAPLHIPNNVDWTTTPNKGKMVIKEQCFNIAAADPAIAQVRQVEQKDPSLTKASTDLPPAGGS